MGGCGQAGQSGSRRSGACNCDLCIAALGTGWRPAGRWYQRGGIVRSGRVIRPVGAAPDSRFHAGLGLVAAVSVAFAQATGG